jgi:DNA repair protein SbcD/Mre11
MKPVRFLHTSDIHLDTSFSSCCFPSRIGDRKRAAMRGTFRRMLEQARGTTDIVLIAGDLFEHDRVTSDTVEFLKQQFESLAPAKVFISPGNHDPYMHGSPYHDEAWPGNVHIFKEEAFRFVELHDFGVRIAGFAFNGTHVSERAFERLMPMPPGSANIVLAHGSNLGRAPAGKAQYAPFTVEDIAGKNILYCALGHYHQQQQVANPLDCTQIWYSGIPEGRGWDEEGSCGYLLGEISETHVSVRSESSTQFPLKTLEIDCDGFSSREQIIDGVLQSRGAVFDNSTILRIRLNGLVDPRLELVLNEMSARLTDEAMHVVWDDRTQPALDFDSMARERTLRGRFVRNLNERIARAKEEDRLTLERARLYGIQALLGREVQIR